MASVKRLLLTLTLACLVALSLTAGAQAGTNTGWSCPTANQWVNLGGGNAYFCRPQTMTWWLMQAPWRPGGV